MDNNRTSDTRKFDFKMDKVEKYASIGLMVIFLASFTDMGSLIWTILLFAIAALVFAYYFKWYRKKPAYILIENEDITIHPPLFFKPQRFKKQDIRQLKVMDKKLEVVYDTQGADNSISIYSILLQQEEMKELTGLLKPEE